MARRLRLGDDPGFFEAFGYSSIVDDEFANGRPVSADQKNRQNRNAIAAKILLAHVKIEPQRLSRLVDIVFTSPNADLSSRVANQWSASFIETNLERRYDATSYARDFLEKRLEQIRAKLEDSERQLVAYAAQQRIVNMPSNVASATGSGADRPLLVDNLAQLNGELSTAIADRVRAESRLGSASGTIPESLQNGTVNQLRTALAQTESEYAKMLTKFEPQYPAAQALQAQIEDLKASLATENARISGSVTTTYREAVRREQDLQSGSMPCRAVCSTCAAAASSTTSTSATWTPTARSMIRCCSATKRSARRPAWASTTSRWSTSAETPDVAVQPDHLAQPGHRAGVRHAGGLRHRAAVRAAGRDHLGPQRRDQDPRAFLCSARCRGWSTRIRYEAAQDPKSALVEAYLSIQTNLEFATDHGAPYTIAVTSSRPAEGKSTTAFTLATLLARAGPQGGAGGWRHAFPLGQRSAAPVARFRPQQLSCRRLGRGRSCCSRATTPNLSVMAAGPKPPNAAELLAGLAGWRGCWSSCANGSTMW